MIYELVASSAGPEDRVFKHWKKEHAVAAIERGTVRLSALSYYLTVENTPEGIRDEMENRVVGSHAPVDFIVDELVQRRLDSHGIRVPVGTSMTMADNFFAVTGPAAYVFCASSSGQEGLFRGYDTVTQMMDPSLFIRSVIEGSNGRLTYGFGGAVTYASRTYDVFNQERLLPDPMIKEPDLAWEREERFVFYPAPNFHDQHMFVTSPGISASFGGSPDAVGF